VAEAVLIGPVSVPFSLLTGKRTGNSAKIDPQNRFLRCFIQPNQCLGSKFPIALNREIFPQNRQSSRRNREAARMYSELLDRIALGALIASHSK
jgi:hypothetical protein